MGWGRKRKEKKGREERWAIKRLEEVVMKKEKGAEESKLKDKTG